MESDSEASDCGPNTKSHNGIESDSDEDTVQIVRKKKSAMILDDSDEEEEEDEMLETNNSDEADNDPQSPTKMDSDEDSNQLHIDEDAAQHLEQSDSEDEPFTAQNEKDEQESDGEMPEDNNVDSTVERLNSSLQVTKGLPNDLFDAEMDSDIEGGGSNKDSSDEGINSSSDEDEPTRPQNTSGSDDNNEDDDGDVPEMSATLKRRLKKGAGKSSTTSSSGGDKIRRPNKNEAQEIHSESQRIVRESALKLPYYKPEKEKLSLSVFLARTKQKQEQLHGHKQQGPAWKQTPEPPPKSDILHEACHRINNSASLERTTEKEEKPICGNEDSACKDTVKKDIMKDFSVAEEEDWDKLPDLIMEKNTTQVRYEVLTAEEAEKSEKQDTDCDNTDICVKECITEQESGYISLPNSEEENSGDNEKKDSLEVCTDRMETENGIHLENKVCAVSDEKCEIYNTQSGNSPNMINNLKTQTMLTPKLANLSVDKFTPKLSGDPDSFIDFDEDVDGQKNTPRVPAGIVNLMERVIKHSAKRPHKKSKDVEISLVSKEKNTKEQDELCVKKVTYHIDEENEESPADTPGAKLLSLKEKLQEQMKQKRQEARQRREELHAYDNEEGYGEEDALMDEEAELTDQTDTDEEEEDMIDDEEELLGGHEDIEEEEEERNPFVDNEADDDEEDGDEDMDTDDSLHLKLDVPGEEDDQESALPTRKDFLKSALKKTKTLELFDEDANTESPTLSQNSRSDCTPEISSRPFQQLSGSSNKTVCEGDHAATESDNDEGQLLMLDTQPVKTTETTPREKDGSLSADSSFEMIGSQIPAGQRTMLKERSADLVTPDIFTPSSKSSAATNPMTTKNSSRLSDLTMPMEESQDLLAQENSTKHGSDCQLESESPNFDFHVDETQSLMLDDEGLIKVRSTTKPTKRQLLMDQSTRGSSSQGTDYELLALCSGKFMEDSQPTDRDSHASKSLFGDSQSTLSSTHNNMDELLGLCSGRFTNATQKAQQQLPLAADDDDDGESVKSTQLNTGPFGVISGSYNKSTARDSPLKKLAQKTKRKRAVIRDEDSNDSFGIVSDGEESDVREEALDSDEDVNHGASDEESNQPTEVDSEDEELRQARQFRGQFTVKNKHGKIRREFVEEEAELSGSEYDSDENLDIAERDDKMEMEAGDLDDVGSEEFLRNQVGRVHLKSLIDADKKELRLFQEMYLQDGDMHSDGAGRTRKFKWRNIDDDDTQHDLFKSDDEDAEGDDGEEQAWRVRRFEREKFLQEIKDMEEDGKSDVIKLGKVVFKSKKDNSQASVRAPIQQESKTVKSTLTGSSKENFTKPRLPAHGSFLRRSKDTLAKIAEMTKPMTALGGARQSGNFIFSAVSPDTKEKQPNTEQKRPQVKRSNSASQQRPNKRPRLERSNTIPQDSIFHLM